MATRRAFRPILTFGMIMMTIGIMGISSCTSSYAVNTPDTPDTEHVIILAFDGWGASSFDAAEMPFLKGMLPKSAWTKHKRSILPTSSACNWATMFNGVGPEAHGYTAWNTREPVFDIIDQNEKGFFPSLFSIYRKQYPDREMGYLYQWEGMEFLFDMGVFNHTKRYAVSTPGSDKMKKEAVSYIREKRPAIAAFIWDYPDKTGHTSGWYTTDYMNELKHIDSIIEAVYNACVEVGIIENTLFVITSDHGGHEKTHHQPLMSDLETPFLLFGSRVNPGEIKVPVLQYDVAAILADYLGLEQPIAWRGRSVNGIFEN